MAVWVPAVGTRPVQIVGNFRAGRSCSPTRRARSPTRRARSPTQPPRSKSLQASAGKGRKGSRGSQDREGGDGGGGSASGGGNGGGGSASGGGQGGWGKQAWTGNRWSGAPREEREKLGRQMLALLRHGHIGNRPVSNDILRQLQKSGGWMKTQEVARLLGAGQEALAAAAQGAWPRMERQGRWIRAKDNHTIELAAPSAAAAAAADAAACSRGSCSGGG